MPIRAQKNAVALNKAVARMTKDGMELVPTLIRRYTCIVEALQLKEKTHLRAVSLLDKFDPHASEA